MIGNLAYSMQWLLKFALRTIGIELPFIVLPCVCIRWEHGKTVRTTRFMVGWWERERGEINKLRPVWTGVTLNVRRLDNLAVFQ